MKTLQPPLNDENSPEQALFSAAFGNNPIPFASRIVDIVRSNGTISIKSNEVRACLLMLVKQSYGQLAEIDTFENRINNTTEYSRLSESLCD